MTYLLDSFTVAPQSFRSLPFSTPIHRGLLAEQIPEVQALHIHHEMIDRQKVSHRNDE
jgi:hypothetical protein